VIRMSVILSKFVIGVFGLDVLRGYVLLLPFLLSLRILVFGSASLLAVTLLGGSILSGKSSWLFFLVPCC